MISRAVAYCNGGSRQMIRKLLRSKTSPLIAMRGNTWQMIGEHLVRKALLIITHHSTCEQMIDEQLAKHALPLGIMYLATLMASNR